MYIGEIYYKVRNGQRERKREKKGTLMPQSIKNDMKMMPAKRKRNEVRQP